MVSIVKIAPKDRWRLRLHGWLLSIWVCTVGAVTSWLLLHVFMLHSMGPRYAINASAVYFIGFVLGGRFYLNWWNGSRSVAEHLPEHATPNEQVEYLQAEEKTRKKFRLLESLGDVSGLGDDPISALIMIIWLICFAFGMLMLLGYAPFFATELLASYMAEIVLEFVIGGLLVRQVLKPRQPDDYWEFIVRRTWIAGIFFVLAFGAIGTLIQHVRPEAKTIVQALFM